MKLLTYVNSRFVMRIVLVGIFAAYLPTGFLQAGAEENLISALTVDKNTVKVAINNKLKANYLEDDFFAEYDADIDLSKMEYEIVTMPLIGNVIAIIWISGQDYYIDSMEEDFFYSLERVKKVFKVLYPKIAWNGNLIPRKLVSLSGVYKQKQKENQIACLFSGGLDSTSTFYAHLDSKKVLITAWGQFDTPLDKEHIWIERKNKIQQFAAKHGDTNAFIKSNYSEFLNWKRLNNLRPEISNWRIGTVEGIGWAGLTAPILLTKGCSSLYIPSGICWYYPYPSCDNPFVDNNISFAGVQLHHDQFEYTRLQKSESIARICNERKIEKPQIKVCQMNTTKDDSNCNKCRKCLSTILSFIAAGEDPQAYGFKISKRKAAKRTVALLNKKMAHCWLWTFTTIQRRMRAIAQSDRSFKADLKPFLTYNLKRTKVEDRENLYTIDWKDLEKLYPSIKVPKDLVQEFLDIQL